MNLLLNSSIGTGYRSASQITRVVTESWVATNMFCPNCGNCKIIQFENNKPVADFFCSECHEQYELKSKAGTIANKVPNGTYKTLIKRITSNSNPDFFFMNYSKERSEVVDFIVVPKYFFTPRLIERRKPLPPTARRAGWIGSNILLGKVPEQGRISIVRDGEVVNKKDVIKQFNSSSKFSTGNIQTRGWLMDILNCVNAIKKDEFTLSEMYYFEPLLQIEHPDNHNIKPKIRQQLQMLRDRGFLEFLGNGKYRKINQ